MCSGLEDLGFRDLVHDGDEGSKVVEEVDRPLGGVPIQNPGTIAVVLRANKRQNVARNEEGLYSREGRRGESCGSPHLR